MVELHSSMTAAIQIIASGVIGYPSNEQGVTFLSSIVYGAFPSPSKREATISENSLLTALFE
jgi:hypothetical protein